MICIRGQVSSACPLDKSHSHSPDVTRSTLWPRLPKNLTPARLPQRFRLRFALLKHKLRRRCACRNRLAHDDCFLEAGKPIDLALDSCVSKHSWRLLERCSGQETVRFQRGFCDALKDQVEGRRLATLRADLAVLQQEFMLAHDLVGEECRIARVDNLHFLQHLANDHLHVLDIDIDTLRTIDLLDFLNQVAGCLLDAHQLKETLRIDGALGKLVTHAHVRSILDTEPRHWQDFELSFDTRLGRDNNLLPLLEVLFFHIDDVQYAVHRRDDRLPLWCTSLEDLLNARQTGCDVNDRDASCVERAEGKLRTGFADGLSRNDTDRLPDLDIIASGQVTAIAHSTNAILTLARNGRTKAHAGDTKLLNGNRYFVTDEAILGNQNDIFVHDHLDGCDAGAFRCRKHLVGKRVALLCKSLLSLSRHDVCRNRSIEDTFERRLRPGWVHLDCRCTKDDVIGCVSASYLFAETDDDSTTVDDRLNGQATNIPLDLQELEAEGFQAFRLFPRDLLTGLDDGLSGQRIHDLFIGDFAR